MTATVHGDLHVSILLWRPLYQEDSRFISETSGEICEGSRIIHESFADVTQKLGATLITWVVIESL